MSAAHKIRVLIVDDHVMVRQGLRAVLQSYPNIDVVGEAGNGEEAVSSVTKLQPAIVVMDIGMPNLDGIGATRLIKTQYPQIAVLGLSVNAPSYHVDAMLKAGLDVPRAGIAHTVEEALALGTSIGYPVIVRASFTLGGGGSGFAADREELAACDEFDVVIVNAELQDVVSRLVDLLVGAGHPAVRPFPQESSS